MWPFSNSAAEIAESATSRFHFSVTALERGITRRDPEKDLNIWKSTDERLEQIPKMSLYLMYQKGWKKGLGIYIESPSTFHVHKYRHGYAPFLDEDWGTEKLMTPKSWYIKQGIAQSQCMQGAAAYGSLVRVAENRGGW